MVTAARIAAQCALSEVPIGSLLVAGRDFMTKIGPDTWRRGEDDSTHTTEAIADFHGWSGYSLLTSRFLF